MLTVKVETNNAAFEGDAKRAEVARILREVADSIEKRGSDMVICRDINGNPVGIAELTRK